MKNVHENLYSIEIQVPYVDNSENEVPPVSHSVKWCPNIEKQKSHREFQKKIASELEKVAELNPLVTIPELSSVAASRWPDGFQGYDTRPRFFDTLSGKHCLVDSGSAVTAIAAGPDDQVNPDLALVAANGTLIECCGYKKVKIQRFEF